MSLRQFVDGTGRILRQYEYEDAVVIVADLGVEDEDVTVDLLDGTAIVVFEHEGREHLHEIELPAGDSQAFMHNGVLTIEVRQ